MGLAYGPATAPVASSAVTYTQAGQVGSLAHTWNGSALNLTYSYNKDHQRSGLTASDATFLPSGLTPGSATYTANTLNQYTAVSGTAFTYDKRGNLTSDGVWTFGYNTENQLISASKTGVTATYSYDPFGRRKWKTVNGVTTAWALFGNQEIAEYQGTGTIFLSRRFVYGSGLDEPIASVNPSNARTYQFQDALGSVIALTNASGLVTEKYAYTANGQTVATGPSTAAYRYTGRRWDAETGLYFYRARAYSPALGRFLQADPIGTAGGINLYAYCGNDPVNRTDPTGLWFWVDDGVFLAGGFAVGVIAQVVVDGIFKQEVSSGRNIIAAGAGGAAAAWAALYTVPTMGPVAGLVVAGGAGGAVNNLAGAAIDRWNEPGKQEHFDYPRLMWDTGVGMATGIIGPGLSVVGSNVGRSISGLNAGRNSYNAIFKQMTTKAINGTASSVTLPTAAAMFLGQGYQSAALQGAIVGGASGLAYDAGVPMLFGELFGGPAYASSIGTGK